MMETQTTEVTATQINAEVPTQEGTTPTESAVTNQGGSAHPSDDFAKLRSTYDARLAAAVKALEEQMRRTQELELKLFETQISGLPEAEREAALRAKRNELELAVMQQRVAQERAVFEQIAKELVINKLSTEYQVPKEKLERFTDPVAMEQFAKEYADLRKTASLQKRLAERTDHVESSGGSPPAYDPAKFRNTGSIAAAIKAKRAAGLF
jgi:hypothetical protein